MAPDLVVDDCSTPVWVVDDCSAPDLAVDDYREETGRWEPDMESETTYVVADLEMCKLQELDPPNKHFTMETIQIGAVLLNAAYEIIDSFNTYVKPKYGRVDTFIRNLTGIDNDMLTDAPDFATALEAFRNWVPEGATIITWSTCDATQIRREAQYKGLTTPELQLFLKGWLDAQRLFAKAIASRRNYSLEEALILACVPQEGNLHNGYTDAYNTALLFRKIKTENPLKINEVFRDAKEGQVKALSFSLGSLLEGLDLPKE